MRNISCFVCSVNLKIFSWTRTKFIVCVLLFQVLLNSDQMKLVSEGCGCCANWRRNQTGHMQIKEWEETKRWPQWHLKKDGGRKGCQVRGKGLKGCTITSFFSFVHRTIVVPFMECFREDNISTHLLVLYLHLRVRIKRFTFFLPLTVTVTKVCSGPLKESVNGLQKKKGVYQALGTEQMVYI